MADTYIIVEVAYAKPEEQVILPVKVPAGATAEQAILESGVLARFSEIDLTINKIGIFSRVCPLDQLLQQADRIEIYRPLGNDPKEARRQRANKDANA